MVYCLSVLYLYMDLCKYKYKNDLSGIFREPKRLASLSNIQ